MNVAYLCVDPGVPVFGRKGSSVHVQEILRAFRARGDRLVVYCTRAGEGIPRDLADVEIRERRVSPSRGAEREVELRRIALQLAEDALSDGVDLVYERYSLFSDALATIVDRSGVPGVLEVNSPLIEEQRRYRSLHNLSGAQEILRRVVGFAAVTVCVSRPVEDWVRAEVTDALTTVAANGVNTARITPAPARAPAPNETVPAEQLTVGFVGTLKPWHGVDVLLHARAISRMPWRLRIIGDGPERGRLVELAGSLGVDVDFVGAVYPEAMPEALYGLDIATAPYPLDGDASSSYFSPLKLYEYAAAGLPVVASRTGQVPEIVSDGVTGTLVEPGNALALARAIDDLVSDAPTRAAMGLAARERAVLRHDWNGVLATILGQLPSPALDPALAGSTMGASGRTA